MKQQIETYGNLIFEYAKKNYRQCFREPDRLLKYKFIVPGSSYSNSLWDWDSWLTDIALSGIAVIEKHGLSVEQTHGPFNRYNQWGNRFAVCLERAYEITKMFGAKYLVVHGDEFDFEKFEFPTEKAIEYNYEIYAPYVERAAKDGISTCTALSLGFDAETAHITDMLERNISEVKLEENKIRLTHKAFEVITLRIQR